MLWEPVIGGLVQKLRRVRKHCKAMCEAFRYPQHALVFGGQFHCNMLPKGRRAAANVHHDIEYRALHHAYQFALRVLDLVVQAAQHVFGRARMVVLHEIYIAASQFGEFAPVEAFKKETAVIAEYLVVR